MAKHDNKHGEHHIEEHTEHTESGTVATDNTSGAVVEKAADPVAATATATATAIGVADAQVIHSTARVMLLHRADATFGKKDGSQEARIDFIRRRWAELGGLNTQGSRSQITKEVNELKAPGSNKVPYQVIFGVTKKAKEEQLARIEAEKAKLAGESIEAQA